MRIHVYRGREHFSIQHVQELVEDLRTSDDPAHKEVITRNLGGFIQDMAFLVSIGAQTAFFATSSALCRYLFSIYSHVMFDSGLNTTGNLFKHRNLGINWCKLFQRSSSSLAFIL